MTVRPLDPDELQAALAELPDWRLQQGALTTAYVAGSSRAAAALLTAIATAAEEADHHPDVDWRYRHVFVRCLTHAARGRATRHDAALAARISALAAEAGLVAEPGLARAYEVGIDATEHAELVPVWAAALGYRVGPDGNDAVDPFRRGPQVWFQGTAAPSPNRLHLDVHVADELQDEVVDAVVAAGGRVDDRAHAPSWVVVADGDGNRVCVCTPHDDPVTE